MIAVLTALYEESEVFISRLKNKKTNIWNGYEFTSGEFGGSFCVVTHTGVGKVNAAVITTRIIETYNPEALFYTGIAGALKPGQNIGDVVIAMESVQWDVDVFIKDYKPGELPVVVMGSGDQKGGSSLRFISTDKGLLEKSLNWKPGGFKVTAGRIITGDSFLTPGQQMERAELIKEISGDAVEMEGAAAGAAARIYNIPFFHARVISDTPDGKKPAGFRKFLRISSGRMADLVEFIITN